MKVSRYTSHLAWPSGPAHGVSLTLKSPWPLSQLRAGPLAIQGAIYLG